MYECYDSGKSATTCTCEVSAVSCEFCKENFPEDITNCLFGNSVYDATEVCDIANCCASALNEYERGVCADASSQYTAPVPPVPGTPSPIPFPVSTNFYCLI